MIDVEPCATGLVELQQMDISSAYCGARALVTGGAGFIGSTLARRLVELGADVTIVDALIPKSGGNLYNIAAFRERVQLRIADLCHIDAMETLVAGQDYIFNLAGQVSHAASIIDPLADLDINCRAQLALLDRCRSLNPSVKIVFASTRQIYGRPTYLPVDERHRLSPVDINGINKMAGESFHVLYNKIFDLKASALRLTNTYGPGMRIKDARQTFIGIWFNKIIHGCTFDVWGGSQKRDFTYVDDVAEAFLLAAMRQETFGIAYNLGGDRAISLRELADLLITINGGGRYEIREFPEHLKRIDIGDYWADDKAFREVTGWQPKVSLEQGLERTLRYYRQNRQQYV